MSDPTMEILKYFWPFISGLISAFIIFWLQRHYRNKDEKILENIKTSIRQVSEVKTHKEKMVTESQFKLYSELWKNLNDLELAVEDLWDGDLSLRTLKAFKDSLRRTDRKVQDSAIILNLEHFQKLSEILTVLKEYRSGKKKLMDVEVVNEESENAVQSLIEGNFDLRCKYIDLKKEILLDLRSGLGL